jgi:predicted phage gp36 major capsid-like protein
VESDYIYMLGERNEEGTGFADAVIDVNDAKALLTVAIDAYYTTKRFTVFAQYDSPMFRKQIRSAYATALRYASTGSYVVTIRHNVDEVKDVNGNLLWTDKVMSCAADDTGKVIKKMEYANGTNGYRHIWQVRNNVLNQDLAMVKMTVNGRIFHARAT